MTIVARFDDEGVRGVEACVPQKCIGTFSRAVSEVWLVSAGTTVLGTSYITCTARHLKAWSQQRVHVEDLCLALKKAHPPLGR
ncbi:hypothetical protein EVAR_103469_1 [Eumeta japonica]|uniref:Uncharacterized protein n=1 Tax=Eumeta variegata TaxID=151549 RepID=A0A4C1YZQ9_EUMVA|nr:hypothetical protein EVAR_103469_1 [Eumeta japonica]